MDTALPIPLLYPSSWLLSTTASASIRLGILMPSPGANNSTHCNGSPACPHFSLDRHLFLDHGSVQFWMVYILRVRPLNHWTYATIHLSQVPGLSCPTSTLELTPQLRNRIFWWIQKARYTCQWERFDRWEEKRSRHITTFFNPQVGNWWQ